jgi:hypothetical protein
VNGIGAYRYGGHDAVGYCVDDGDRVCASVGYVGSGPIGSEGRINGIDSYRYGGHDGIG